MGVIHNVKERARLDGGVSCEEGQRETFLLTIVILEPRTIHWFLSERLISVRYIVH